MSSLNPVTGRRALLLSLALLMLPWLQAYGQSCSCPPIATCGCNVGITKLTVQFTGLLSVTVSVEDNGGNILTGLLLLPGSTFEVESSAGSGQPFVGHVVRISGLLIGTTTINTSCSSNLVKVGSDFGSFTVIAGESVGGVPICCEVMETTLPVISGCPTDITVSSSPSDCGVNVSWTAPTVADNCAVSSFTASHNPGDFFPEGTTTVIYQAEDNYGNVASCSFDVTVNDDTDPLINGCPSNITVSADASCEAVVSWIAPTASDNCSVAAFTSNHNPGETFPLGTTTVTYAATDGSGNIATCSFDVMVSDDDDPVITGCPADIYVSADASCQAVVNWTLPTAADNCSVSSFISDHNPGETFALGTTTVTYTATDGAGNTAICSFDIIVTDDTDPLISGCPSNIVVSADASCQAIVSWTAPTASDNCSVASFISDHNPGETFALGTTTVTYTATDDAGNTAICSFDIIVTDDTDPLISGCPSNIVVSANASCQAVANWTAPTASDNCSVTSFISDHNPGETFPLGTTTVTYTATDGAGNTANCSFDITVTDDTDPLISGCPSNIAVAADASCQAVVNWTAPTASDNCSVVSFTSNHNPGETFPLGTTTVTYTAADGSGNIATCSFDVIVSDDIDPVITGCPADIYVSADGSCQAVVNWTAPTASDNCSVDSFTSDHNPGEPFPLGNTTVTYTATDAAGNTAICSFDIIVTDDTNPLISACPSNIAVSADASCQAVANWTIPTAADNCSIASFTSDHNPGETFPLGTTTVTYTATDGSGNIAICSFDVIVSDDADPVITACPSDIYVSADASCEAVANWTAPTASDNCSVVSFTGDYNPGETFSLGTTTVTYTATDGSGNIATCSFDVIVSDDADPVITACPADVYVSADASCEAVANWTAPTASDNCSVAAFTSDHNPGETFPLGTTTVTYTATDGSGNIATCSFDVIVSDDVDPVITGCPSDIYVSADASCEAVVNWTAPTASDNCSVAAFTSDHNPGEAFPFGTTKVTYTVTDGSGNMVTCSFDVIVDDDTDPIISGCSADIQVSADASCEAIANWSMPTASDNCSVTSFASDRNPGEIFPLGTTTVTYTATDGAGNIATCSFDVIVMDNADPVITGCPADINASVDASCQAIVNWTSPAASDNCTIVSFVSDHNPGEIFPAGTTTVTYTATDNAGNVATCAFDVIVSDDTDPVISGCPADIHVSAGASCEGVANWILPTAEDCSPVTLTSSHQPGAPFPVGSTEVIYTATDNSGNSSSCKFNVVVDDDTPPVFESCPAEISITTDDACRAIAHWTVPTTTDNCQVASLTSSHSPGDTFQAGITEVEYKATDNSGNTSYCRFNVVVKAEEPPVISDCPADILVRAGEAGAVSVSWEPPTATAVCGNVTLTSSHEPGSLFAIGETLVEYTAIDESGNTTRCTFNVIVSFEDLTFEVVKVVTPDGDGINDEWILPNIEKFSDNNVVIVDRWGSVIYSASGYNNKTVVWKGINSNGALVPTGTYFYVIQVDFREEKMKKTGFIELIR